MFSYFRIYLLLPFSLIFAIVFSTAFSASAKEYTLECLYNYSNSIKNPDPTTTNKNSSFKPFVIKADKKGIAPSFCDTVTRGFTTTRLHYLHCQSKDRMVRTEHEMIVDRKSLSVTTTLHFYVNDKFMAGVIHLGQCEYLQSTNAP